MSARPRIVICLPEDPLSSHVMGDVARRLRDQEEADLLLVGPSERGGDWGRPERLEALDALGAVVSASRLAHWVGDRGEAERLLADGRVDGLVLLDPSPPPGPRLRLRAGVRVIEAYPETDLAVLLERLAAVDLARIAGDARDLLQALGLAQPRIALFDLPGHPAPARAAAQAREARIDLAGPFPPGRAVEQGADALLALTPAQVELPLSLRGSGPETVLALGRPWAWVPTPSRPDALPTAVRHLARALGAWGPLAVEREQQPRLRPRPPVSVSVARRSPPVDVNRCPYCHKYLTESPTEELGRAGPPFVCTTCGTGHHRDCLQEHGACTVLGCTCGRFERLGVSFDLAWIGPASSRKHPFLVSEGDVDLGPDWLRVEEPIDDPRSPANRAVSLELAAAARRGDFVHGFIRIATPRPWVVRGGCLRLKATLTTTTLRRTGRVASRRTQTITAREAVFLGEGVAATALGRLQGLFGGGGLTLPAGVRRYPFSFELPSRHPATVQNRHPDVEESVKTEVEVVIDRTGSGPHPLDVS